MATGVAPPQPALVVEPVEQPAPSPRPTSATAAAPSPARVRTLPYLPGLDGLRAVAVLAVILYHLELGEGWASGGYLGVEVFFVVSGYLITGLLLHEHGRSDRIDLRRFWTRRARRLLPAALVVVGATVVGAALFAPPDLALFRGDAVASLLYVQNWHAVLAEQPYFASFGRPSPLRHLWSLSIEEQFYVVWPVLVLLGQRFLSRRTLLVLTLAGAAASAWLMAAVTQIDDLERGYYGTDTRAFPLLIGAALAMVWRPGRRFRDRRGRHAPWAIDAVAALALLALLWQMSRRSEFDPWTFPYGLLWVDLLTIVLIIASATVGSKVARGLAARPLVAIGRRSYSLYLWHWPIFVFTRPGTDVDLDPWVANPLRIMATVVVAEVSFRLVEQPFRDGRAQAVLARVWAGRRPALTGITAAAGTILVVATVAIAVRAEPPEATSPVPQVATLPPVGDLDPVGSAPTTEAPPATEPTGGVAHPPTTAPIPTAARDVIAEPVTAIGDSVMLGARPGLERRFADVAVDADVGLLPGDIVDHVSARADQGDLRATVVVQIGNNGPVTDDDLERLLDVAGDRRLVLVNVSVPRRWEGQVNDALAGFADDHPEVALVDWAGAVAEGEGLKVEDDVHLSAEGIALYADLVAAAVTA